MLNDYPVSAMIPVTDLDRAKKFYGETLGLKQVHVSQTGDTTYEAGKGTNLSVYKRPPTHPEHTLAGFLVDDIEKVVADLRGKGITFEEYDIPEMQLKTVNGIATLGDEKAAWFKDPDGNILSLFQQS